MRSKLFIVGFVLGVAPFVAANIYAYRQMGFHGGAGAMIAPSPSASRSHCGSKAASWVWSAFCGAAFWQMFQSRWPLESRWGWCSRASQGRADGCDEGAGVRMACSLRRASGLTSACTRPATRRLLLLG